MSKHKVTAKNLPLVWMRFTKWIVEEVDGKRANVIAHDLDRWLDELVSQDAFGTEAQCDPRGDQRD